MSIEDIVGWSAVGGTIFWIILWVFGGAYSPSDIVVLSQLKPCHTSNAGSYSVTLGEKI